MWVVGNAKAQPAQKASSFFGSPFTAEHDCHFVAIELLPLRRLLELQT
jgi:hypothetical protein